MKKPIINSYLLARGGKVKPPGEGFLSIGNLSDCHVGPAGLEQVIQDAFVFRGKMLDKDQGKAEIRRQYGEKRRTGSRAPAEAPMATTGQR